VWGGGGGRVFLERWIRVIWAYSTKLA